MENNPTIKTLLLSVTKEAANALYNYKILNGFKSQSDALNHLLLRTTKDYQLPKKLIPKYKRRALKGTMPPKPIIMPITNNVLEPQEPLTQQINPLKTLPNKELKPKKEVKPDLEIDF